MSLEALARNGHHLELGLFEQSGPYGIPVLHPVRLEQRLEWIRFNHALREHDREKYGVHFYIDDYLFLRVWNDPPRYAAFLSQFPAVMTPDFSMFTDYPLAVQVYHHWRKHLLGAYWQQQGLTVIPSVGWSTPDSYAWCFDGEPEGGTVSVSSVGKMKNRDARQLFVSGYKEMRSRLQPGKIIFFGDIPDECDGPIEHHSPYYEAFTRRKPFTFRGR